MTFSKPMAQFKKSHWLTFFVLSIALSLSSAAFISYKAFNSVVQHGVAGDMDHLQRPISREEFNALKRKFERGREENNKINWTSKHYGKTIERVGFVICFLWFILGAYLAKKRARNLIFLVAPQMLFVIFGCPGIVLFLLLASSFFLGFFLNQIKLKVS